ncbi:MAG TPA: N-acetyltransferase [Oscillospiraceae bacterium]|nr:N-acetyltransferase [Oscillospiraceae bacterium]
MDTNGLVLRPERPEDHRKTEELTREAFWNVHVPGCCEHYLLHEMRRADAFLAGLDFVAELGGRLVGNIVYTRAELLLDSGTRREAISFGPLSVRPEYQGRGVGGALIEHTKKLAREAGHTAILIYGDPAYYGRFGFLPAETYGIGTPDDMYAAPLQALELYRGALKDARGRFFEDAVFDVDEGAAAAFDADFLPPGEKREDLPSQARFRSLVGMRKPRK